MERLRCGSGFAAGRDVAAPESCRSWPLSLILLPMKVALVFPRETNMATVPNLGLGYLSAVISREGFENRIYHCAKERLDPAGLAASLLEFRPDVVGLQSYSFFHNKARRAAAVVKSSLPDAKIVIGGPHASGLPHSVLSEEPAFDFGFSGEAEIGFPALLRLLTGDGTDERTIPGLIWRDGGTINANPQQSVKDLDLLPFPAWDKMDVKGYPHHAHGVFAPGFPVVPMAYSRGCNYNCSYCAARTISGPGVRYRSPENMIKEIEYVYCELGVKVASFVDQNLTANREAAMRLCYGLIKSGFNLKWYCPNGVYLDSLDDELLEKMSAAGCESIAVGIESASSGSLKSLGRKALDLKDVREKLLMIKKRGIGVTGNFMFGLPGEDEKDFRNTFSAALKLPLDRAQFAFFAPFPGTRFFSDRFPDSTADWDDFNVIAPNFIAAPLRNKARLLMVSAFLFFYARPAVFWRNLREIRSARHAAFVLSKIINIAKILKK